YRLAMLLAAYLPHQAEEEIVSYAEVLPNLRKNPLIWIIEAMIHIENRKNEADLQFVLDRQVQELKADKAPRPILDAYQWLAYFLEHRKIKSGELTLYPEPWENLLRLDLYLQAKSETKFYYNLILEEWQKRRRVL